MHTCEGCAILPRRERLWHRLYRAWYDHDLAGHRARARVAGVLADAWARIIWS